MSDMLGPYELNTIVTGDARELMKAIPDESVDLIFTDPVYDRIDDYRWLTEMAARILKPNAAALIWIGIGNMADVLPAMSALHYRWMLISALPVGKRGMLVHGRMFSNWRCLLWMEKGKSKMYQYVGDLNMETDNSFDGMMRWGKSIVVSKRILSAYTKNDFVVLDPFMGGGTTGVVCKMLGRRYLGFEIDAKRAQEARQRVDDTQPPLFGLQPEQLSFNTEQQP